MVVIIILTSGMLKVHVKHFGLQVFNVKNTQYQKILLKTSIESLNYIYNICYINI